jgi:enamine deaminase RidA (YjgF/YER057c/UK114 family)
MKKQFIVQDDRRRGAFSVETQAVRAGHMIFVGGQMSLGAAGQVVGSDVRTQAHNIFESLIRVLAEAGASMTDVVKHNIYFDCAADDETIAEFMADLNAVRHDYFTDPGPTTTEIRVGLDREGALLMIDAWAVIGVEKERLTPPGHWNWTDSLPFSQGWKVGDIVFVGGQRSLDAQGQLLGSGDIEAQTANSFRNLETTLQEAGADRNNLMRQNTYFRFFGQGREVTDYWERMTAVRRQYMSVPAAAGVGVRIPGFSGCAGSSGVEELIQVEGIGVLGEEKQRLMPPNHWDWSITGNEFTQGWRIGDLVFVGGQISADANAKAVGRNLRDQTRNVFQFIRNTLGEAGLDESDVVKLCIYYCAEEGWAQVAEAVATIAGVQKEFYAGPAPVVTAMRVSGFAFENLLIEVEAIAITRDSSGAEILVTSIGREPSEGL